MGNISLYADAIKTRWKSMNPKATERLEIDGRLDDIVEQEAVRRIAMEDNLRAQGVHWTAVDEIVRDWCWGPLDYPLPANDEDGDNAE